MMRLSQKFKECRMPLWAWFVTAHLALWLIVCVIEAILPDRPPRNVDDFFDFGSSHKGYFIDLLENLDFYGIQLWFRFARMLILVEPSVLLYLPVNRFFLTLVFGTIQWAVLGAVFDLAAKNKRARTIRIFVSILIGIHLLIVAFVSFFNFGFW